MALATATIVELALLLALPGPANPDKPGVTGGIRTVSAQLRGEGPPVDLVQDYAGARAMVSGADPYPMLTQAYTEVGIRWPVNHRSTHPPTAFLLVMPVAWLPWNVAAAVWGVLMLAALGGSIWAFGAKPGVAAALTPLALLWPPAAWSVGQLTPVWLLGLALAWRFRNHAREAGALIALASLSKIMPALALTPFALNRSWRAVWTFGILTGLASLALLLPRPSPLIRYLEIAGSTSAEQVTRGDNSALLPAATHAFGAAGMVGALLVTAIVVSTSIQRWHRGIKLDLWEWHVWTWVGVALLPIAWIYSVLPLAPSLVSVLRHGGVIERMLALVGVSIPFLIEPFGMPGAIQLATATACTGLAIAIARARAGAELSRPDAAQTAPTP
jgi:Glycosyltransferase family 87